MLASAAIARPHAPLPCIAAVLVAAAFALVGCSNKSGDEPRRAPPPPKPTAQAAACADGGGKVVDAETASYFPRTHSGFCVDPNGSEKTFGDGASLALEKICDVFDGECEIYKEYNIRRLVEVHYVDGAASPATIEVRLSKFATTEGAYGMFTKRVVGDGDPAGEDTPKPTAADGAGALGLGNAYLWRGLYLAEITYNDERAAEATIKGTSEKLLPPLVEALSKKLPGETAPPSLAALPKEDRLPLGERFATKDLLGVDGVGSGIFGYYRSGPKRFRMAALVRADVDQAKDIVSTFGKVAGATREKHVGDGAVRLMRKEGDGAPVEWVFARTGKTVLGIGDEPRALKSGATSEEHAAVSFTTEEKIERLKKYLGPGQ